MFCLNVESFVYTWESSIYITKNKGNQHRDGVWICEEELTKYAFVLDVIWNTRKSVYHISKHLEVR